MVPVKCTSTLPHLMRILTQDLRGLQVGGECLVMHWYGNEKLTSDQTRNTRKDDEKSKLDLTGDVVT